RIEERPSENDLGGPFLLVRPAWAPPSGCKSPRKLTMTIEVKRNCRRATDCGKEAWSASMGRRTDTGSEAEPTRASGPKTAKLLWSRGGDVNPAVVWRRVAFLPGELSPYA